MSAPPDVYRYLDYRRLLSDYYHHKKAEGRSFPYRAFARRAGLGSPNHLKRVMDGARNLSDDSVERYAGAMGLRGEAAEYFATLVRFNQAKSRQQRERAYERIQSFRGYREAQVIDARYADYHAHWYIPAIREMALVKGFKAEPEWIAARMLPPISTREARDALSVLFALGMLVRDDAGAVRQADPVVTTGPQTAGLHIARFHEAMLERAAHAIREVSAEQRKVTALTFCVDEAGLARVHERLERFRQELVAMLAEQREGDRVVQLGLQLFPLTKGPIK